MKKLKLELLKKEVSEGEKYIIQGDWAVTFQNETKDESEHITFWVWDEDDKGWLYDEIIIDEKLNLIKKAIKKLEAK